MRLKGRTSLAVDLLICAYLSTVDMLFLAKALDQAFEKTLMEWMDKQEKEDHYSIGTNTMHILLGELKELSEQAKNALNSKGSALEDPNSYLRWVLDSMENDDGEGKILIKDDLALMQLKDAAHNQLIYVEGVVNGLHEAKLRFPDLDVWATLKTVISWIDMAGFFVAPQ
ncbi:hypothetical protein E2542_SST21636 [Spatholobus suberectus]|nr:hypothetical protein E2542_SST21636 [Spatholobus suberectus]